MYISALDKDFPMVYTVEAQTALAEKAGGRLEDLDKLFDDDDAADYTEKWIEVMALLMKAATNREKVKCKALGEEYTGKESPTSEELRALLTMEEVKQGIVDVAAAMKVGNSSTVETEEEKGKNVEAAQ